MVENSEIPKLLCQDILIRLKEELALPDGSIIPAGTLVLLLPQTIADCVLTPEGKSLASVWETICRDGHTHKEIATFSEELIRFSERLVRLETAFAALKNNT